MNLYNWLFESTDYKVYSNYEYVYLKDKRISFNHDRHEKVDILVEWIYGDPTGAIITPDQKYVIVVGSGIYIYNIISGDLKTFFSEPNSLKWIETIYLAEEDDWNNEFRIVSFKDNFKLQIFKFNIASETLTVID